MRPDGDGADARTGELSRRLRESAHPAPAGDDGGRAARIADLAAAEVQEYDDPRIRERSRPPVRRMQRKLRRSLVAAGRRVRVRAGVALAPVGARIGALLRSARAAASEGLRSLGAAISRWLRGLGPALVFAMRSAGRHLLGGLRSLGRATGRRGAGVGRTTWKRGKVVVVATLLLGGLALTGARVQRHAPPVRDAGVQGLADAARQVDAWRLSLEGRGVELHRALELAGWIDGRPQAAPAPPAATPTRYAVRVVTTPPGALVRFGGHSARTPAEIELDALPERPLRLVIGKRGHRREVRRLSPEDFVRRGALLVSEVDVTLRSAPKAAAVAAARPTSGAASRQEPASRDSDAPAEPGAGQLSFRLEPMPTPSAKIGGDPPAQAAASREGAAADSPVTDR